MNTDKSKQYVNHNLSKENVEQFNQHSLFYELGCEITEQIDYWVLSGIQNNIYDRTKTIIPKKLIIRALETFKQEHKEEYEILMKVGE